MATQVGAAEARRRLGALLARVQYAGERFLITRDGKAAAALVSVEDLERVEKLEELLDVLLVRLLQAQGEEPVPVEDLIEQYEHLFDKSLAVKS